MRKESLSKKTAKELEIMAAEERAKLQQLQFGIREGRVKNVREIREARRNIAQILTAITQKQ